MATRTCNAIENVRLERLVNELIDVRMEAGDSKTEALRLLRRRISDEVYRRLLADEDRIQAPALPSHRAA